MKVRLALFIAVLSLLAFVPLAQAATTTSSSSPSSGSVTYRVQTTVNGTSSAATVTENVTPASAGQSIIQLAVEGTQSNFTYSHVVNSSLELFPYLPAVSNESYTYSAKGYTVTASISQDGTSQATFQGKSYTMTDYAFSAEVSSANGTQTIAGSLSIFPSDLVYSVAAHGTEASASATLTATSLTLTAGAAPAGLQATSAGVGIGLAAGAVALSLGVKYRNRPQATGPKPDHWVD